MPSSLVADAALLCEKGFAVSRADLAAFAEAHPIEEIYAELAGSSATEASSTTSTGGSSSTIDAASVAVVARALAKVFADAEIADKLLPRACPFAVAALKRASSSDDEEEKSSEQIRVLAVDVLGRCVATGVRGGGGGATSSSSSAAGAASALVGALCDRSAAVGAAAERSGRLAAATEVGIRELLSAGLVEHMSLSSSSASPASSSAPLARARALSVAAAALSAGGAPAAALRDAGAFAALRDQLAPEVVSRDPLSAAAALATISDAVDGALEGARGDEATAAFVGELLASEVGRPLGLLIASSSSSSGSSSLPKIDSAVRSQALQTAAKLVAAAVGGRDAAKGDGTETGGAATAAAGAGAGNDNDSTDAAAVAAAPSTSSPIPSPASPVGGLAAAVLASIERALDEEAAFGRAGEVREGGSANVDDDERTEQEASLLALAELASTAAGASLVAAASPDALRDASRIALGGRGPSSCRLAALHALASVAGVERMKRKRTRGGATTTTMETEEGEGEQSNGGVLLPGAGESVLAEVLHFGASTRGGGGGVAGGNGFGGDSSLAGALLSLVARQPLLEEKIAAFRLTLALSARPWGAAEVTMHPGLLERVCDVAADAAGAAAEWRHAVAVALDETATSSASSSPSLGPTQLASLASARPVLEAAVRAGPHGIGGPAPRFVATRAAGN